MSSSSSSSSSSSAAAASAMMELDDSSRYLRSASPPPIDSHSLAPPSSSSSSSTSLSPGDVSNKRYSNGSLSAYDDDILTLAYLANSAPPPSSSSSSVAAAAAALDATRVKIEEDEMNLSQDALMHIRAAKLAADAVAEAARAADASLSRFGHDGSIHLHGEEDVEEIEVVTDDDENDKSEGNESDYDMEADENNHEKKKRKKRKYGRQKVKSEFDISVYETRETNSAQEEADRAADPVVESSVADDTNMSHAESTSSGKRRERSASPALPANSSTSSSSSSSSSSTSSGSKRRKPKRSSSGSKRRKSRSKKKRSRRKSDNDGGDSSSSSSTDIASETDDDPRSKSAAEDQNNADAAPDVSADPTDEAGVVDQDASMMDVNEAPAADGSRVTFPLNCIIHGRKTIPWLSRAYLCEQYAYNGCCCPVSKVERMCSDCARQELWKDPLIKYRAIVAKGADEAKRIEARAMDMFRIRHQTNLPSINLRCYVARRRDMKAVRRAVDYAYRIMHMPGLACSLCPPLSEPDDSIEPFDELLQKRTVGMLTYVSFFLSRIPIAMEGVYDVTCCARIVNQHHTASKTLRAALLLTFAQCTDCSCWDKVALLLSDKEFVYYASPADVFASHDIQGKASDAIPRRKNFHIQTLIKIERDAETETHSEISHMSQQRLLCNKCNFVSFLIPLFVFFVVVCFRLCLHRGR